jgi:zinc D-Ala-D-Ala carboxypeptidase
MISEEFKLSDYTHSDTATAKGFDENFTPPQEIIDNLQLLHENIVVPLLQILTEGNLLITSGYRCERLNTAVGGVSNSEHMKGMAVDLNYFADGVKNDKVIWDAVKQNNIQYRQMGWEHAGAWVHISYNVDDLKMEDFNVN